MVRSIVRRFAAARRAFVDPPHVPPGHFYSPLLGREERAGLAARRLAEPPAPELPAINLNAAAQWELLEDIRGLYLELPWAETGAVSTGLRYHYGNSNYRYSDAVFYFLVLRHFRPRRVIEVGSGYSSALLLDVNEMFLGSATDVTFIEPYPDVLRRVASERDLEGRLVVSGLQDVGLEVFEALGDGDVLFVDSTHVSKAGSDVNYLLFEVLPRLAPGVLVHVHDIFYPFEYPAQWINDGWAWNEAYMLRSFLQFNQAFDIVLYNTYLESVDRPWFAANMPICLKDEGGSIWLRRKPHVG